MAIEKGFPLSSGLKEKRNPSKPRKSKYNFPFNLSHFQLLQLLPKIFLKNSNNFIIFFLILAFKIKTTLLDLKVNH